MTKNIDSNGLFTDDPGMMTTFTGRRVNPLTMVADDVDIEDIAHGLARQCRYNGHTAGYLSVARHSVWVASRLRDQGFARKTILAGLLHDAAEAYLGDMIRPLKHGELGVGYLKVEARLESEIAKAFGIRFPLPKCVMEADRFVLMEVELPRPNGARYAYDSTPAADECTFLSAFFRLTKETS